MKQLTEREVEVIRQIAQAFIDKVDAGKARSKETYADMKTILKILS